MKETVNIEKIPYIGYCLAFMEHRTAYSDLFAKEAAGNGQLLCAKSDGHFVGYICAADTGRELRVTYAYTVPQLRKQGIFTTLLSYIVKNSDITVRVVLPEEHEFHDSVAGICRRLGFITGESVIIYSYRPDEDTKWHRYMERYGNRICSKLKAQGYSAISFAEAGEDIIRQIRESDKSDFGNPFETRSFFDDPERNLSLELSFAAVKDGELAAYSLASSPTVGKAVMEQIAVSIKKRGKGVIFLPFAESMKRFFETGGEAAFYAIYGSNTDANSFRDKVVDIASKKISENYYHSPGSDSIILDRLASSCKDDASQTARRMAQSFKENS